MKKMPTLFQREFDRHRVVNITDQLTSPELAWVLAGEGIATEKIDGACCALIGGQFYKRYDAKKNKQGILKQPPVGNIDHSVMIELSLKECWHFLHCVSPPDS